ncbi:alpha/beta hydrolase [Hephaestia sp. GCM10023244]|uniref:alpha/beta hydrolase n=1 Tax=unclassified Hephaestia TaxID=2631281 RepID=UPI0020776B07|nr:alpha/beta hydrolase [Hephaestia sp. MAHUQ-44]MCM8730775.1 lysophospholipase [Hephaestia sp. MAHUQ-44]
MIRPLLAAGLLALAAGCQNQPTANDAAANAAAAAPAIKPAVVWLQASDQKSIRGDFYEARNPKALILLFHQAGSSKEEYATIAPKLAAAGYSALAIDQRAGGDLYGHNETVERMGGSKPYEEAMADLDGAVRWARPIGLPVVLWGSSYSASLVIPVASSYPEVVKAVLAFSPGEYMQDKHSVGRSAEYLPQPIFITAANDPKEIAAARAIAARVPGGKATFFTPPEGAIHGASTLIEAKDPQGAAPTWQAVMDFLKKTVG